MRKRMVGAISGAMLLVGCGASEEYANDPRPAAPLIVAVSVTGERVGVSPRTIGAGPAILTVSNQSDRSQDVTLTAPEGSDSACVGADASSGPINPMGTARLAVELVEGDCIVSAGDGRDGPRPARLVVGTARATSQPDLLRP